MQLALSRFYPLDAGLVNDLGPGHMIPESYKQSAVH